MSEKTTYELRDGIAIVTMDDGKANALGPEMSAALSAAMDRAAEEAEVLVITGRAGVFCGGFDLKIINGGDAAAREAMVAAGAEMILKLYLQPQPVVLAIGGHAIAAGALITLAGDVRIGIEGETKIGLNETAIGLALPAFAIELARDRLEETQLTEATLGARLYDPEAAAGIGYLDQVVAPAGLLERALAAAAELKALDRNAYGSAKQRLRRGIFDRIAAVEAAEI